ncbi:MAG: hypothetical protein IPH72_19045 [Sandaracinaceae bacterium]|nr:hypothetical protein [Sandaracinaceae bacterium]
MKQIGMYYDCLTGKYCDDKPSRWRFFGYTVFMLTLAPLASWLSVSSAAWSWLRWKATHVVPPDEVKRLHYRLAHVPMTKAQMIVWQEELSKALGLVGPVRTGGSDRDRDPTVLVIDPGEWFRRVRVQPENTTMEFYQTTPDREVFYYSTYEYRFEKDELLVRLREDRCESYEGSEWSVRDGVVLESDLRERFGKNTLFGGVEERVADLHRKVKWHAHASILVRLFAMKMHPELFKYAEIMAESRGELQRIGSSVEKSLAEAQRLGFAIVEDEVGVTFRFGSEWSDSEKKNAEETLSLAMEDSGTTFNELSAYKRSRTGLLDLINS